MATLKGANEVHIHEGVKSEVVRLYDWNDIQNEICRRLDIEEIEFVHYRTGYPGDVIYDCWHAFIQWVFYEDLHNGHACWLYECDTEYFEDDQQWFIPVVEVYNEIIREESGEENGSILVLFDW
jgi:hypothetical protein